MRAFCCRTSATSSEIPRLRQWAISRGSSAEPRPRPLRFERTSSANSAVATTDVCTHQRAILGTQTAQVHRSTAEVDRFPAFPGGDVPAGPGLCIDSPLDVKTGSPTAPPRLSDRAARPCERQDATAYEMHPGTRGVIVLSPVSSFQHVISLSELLNSTVRLRKSLQWTQCPVAPPRRVLETDSMYAARFRRWSSQSGPAVIRLRRRVRSGAQARPAPGDNCPRRWCTLAKRTLRLHGTRRRGAGGGFTRAAEATPCIMSRES